MSRRARALLALVSVLAAALGVVAVAPPAGAAGSPAPTPKAYALVDADSGTVLAASNEHEARSTASTVKIMTGLTALRRLPIGATVKVSARAAAQPAMRIGMHEGEVWTLDDVLHVMYMVSANDAAYALAEAAGGTVEQFAAEMNDTANQLGMRDSTFSDPAGLDDASSYNGGSHISAYDLTIAARNALAVPEIANVVKLVDYKFTGPDGVVHALHSHNATFLTKYFGATGMKTGYTAKSGRTLICTASRGGRTMIGVVLDIYDTDGWCERLLDQGFATAPNAAGTGATVPPVRIFTTSARQRAVDGLPAVLGRPALPTATTASPTTATPSSAAPTTATPSPAAPTTANPTTATPTTATPTSAAGPTGTSAGKVAPATTSPEKASIFTVRNAVIVVFVVLLTLFFLRRRAVKRRRHRRIVRQKQLADARRRGMIHVLEPDPGPIHVEVVTHDRQYGTDDRAELSRG